MAEVIVCYANRIAMTNGYRLAAMLGLPLAISS
jgi:hypothetical protein